MPVDRDLRGAGTGLAIDARHHELDRDQADALERLAVTGDRSLQHLVPVGITERHDRQVVRHPEPDLAGPTEDAEDDLTARRKQGGWGALPREQAGLVLPQLGALTGSALDEALVIAEGMRVDPQRMRANLDLDGGLIMAEAQMIQLADHLGREHAHDLVYEAATRARKTNRVLADVLPEVANEQGKTDLLPERLVQPEDYPGEAVHIVSSAVDAWRSLPPAPVPALDVAQLARSVVIA